MMNCVDARELIQLYMDDELSSREALDVQHHIDSCSACATLLDYFTRQDEALRLFARSEAADHTLLREQILKDIRNQSLAAVPRRQWWLGLAQSPALRRIAAVLIVGLVIGFFLLRGGINPKVYADAVADHSDHCTLERLDSFKVTVRDPEKLNELAVKNSKLAKLPDLSDFGYANPRAVMCTLNGKRLLHLVFQSNSERPLSIFMGLHDKKIVEDDITTLTRGDCKVASMSTDGTDLLVVSFLDESKTATIAKAIAAQLQR